LIETGCAELEQDLRNSTLLVRFAKADFGFTHTSMQEFFIAQKLTTVISCSFS
jgi:hypothetical protein